MEAIEKDLKREALIIKEYLAGEKIKVIAKNYGISNQRVSQIAKRNGYSSLDRAGFISKNEKIEKANKIKMQAWSKRNLECISRAGCGIEEYEKIRLIKSNSGLTPQQAFKAHKRNSRTRGIEFKFKFKDWWDIWDKSGQWGNRGMKMGQYVMGRKDDKGPYSAENVIIQTCSSNVSDGHAYRSKVLCKKA